MKIKLELSISGTRNGEAWPAAGEVVDLPDVEANDLIVSGAASAVEVKAAPRKPEKAVAKKPEKRA